MTLTVTPQMKPTEALRARALATGMRRRLDAWRRVLSQLSTDSVERNVWQAVYGRHTSIKVDESNAGQVQTWKTRAACAHAPCMCMQHYTCIHVYVLCMHMGMRVGVELTKGQGGGLSSVQELVTGSKARASRRNSRVTCDQIPQTVAGTLLGHTCSDWDVTNGEAQL